MSVRWVWIRGVNALPWKVLWRLRSCKERAESLARVTKGVVVVRD